MRRILVYFFLFLLLSIVNVSLVNKLFAAMGDFTHIQTLGLIRIDLLILFVTYLATTEAFSSAIIAFILGITAGYFSPALPNAPVVTAIFLFLVARATNEGFLIRSFYGGGPFVFLFIVLTRLIMIFFFISILDKPILSHEIAVSLVPTALVNALIAPSLFSALEKYESYLIKVKDEYLR